MTHQLIPTAYPIEPSAPSLEGELPHVADATTEYQLLVPQQEESPRVSSFRCTKIILFVLTVVMIYYIVSRYIYE